MTIRAALQNKLMGKSAYGSQWVKITLWQYIKVSGLLPAAIGDQMAFTQKMWVVSLHVVCQGSPKAPKHRLCCCPWPPWDRWHDVYYSVKLSYAVFFYWKVILEAKFPSSPPQTQACFSQSVLKGPYLEMTPPKEKRTAKEPKTKNTLPLQTARRWPVSNIVYCYLSSYTKRPIEGKEKEDIQPWEANPWTKCSICNSSKISQFHQLVSDWRLQAPDFSVLLFCCYLFFLGGGVGPHPIGH